MSDMIEQLANLVAEERAALLAGDFDLVAELYEQKQAMVATMEDDPLDPAEIAPLRSEMERNQVLFDRMLEGLRSVATRISDLAEARKSLNMYDARGQRQTIAAPVGTTIDSRA